MVNFRRFCIVFVLALLASHTVFAQADTEFWFVAPDVTGGHAGSTDNSGLGNNDNDAIRLTAGNVDAEVTVCILAGASCKTYTVLANTQLTIKAEALLWAPNWPEFTVANLENQGLNHVNTKGIHITSTSPITAYYEVANKWNPDIFTMKGVNSLGTQFIVPSQNLFSNSNGYMPLPYEQINIVATQPDTKIKIAPKVKGSLIGVANTVDTIYVTLQAGETYSISSNNQIAAASLAGTFISADKNIAVTISDDSIVSSGQDLIGDQLIPLSVIGTDYVAMRCTPVGNPTSGIVNKVFITATVNGTKVYVDGYPVQIFNKGDVKWFDIIGSGGSATYIHCSEAVYAYQVSGIAGELGSAILPTITGCTGSESVSFTRHLLESFWVQIMVQKKNLGKFKMYSSDAPTTPIVNMTDALNNTMNKTDVVWNRVNDNKIPATPANDEWYVATINMANNPFSLVTLGPSYSISNDQGLFHLSILDANGGSMSFGYFSSYASVGIEPVVGQECFGNNIELTSKTNNNSYAYQWTSKSGISLVPGNLPTQLVAISDVYYLRRSNARCAATDSMKVVFDKPEFTLSNLGTVCPNEKIVLYAKPIDAGALYTYTWTPTSLYNDSTILTLSPGAAQLVTVVATKGKCTSTTATTIAAFNGAIVDLTSVGANLCVGDTIRNNGTLKEYLWTFPNNTTSDSKYIIATTSGIYKLTGTSIDGCTATSTKSITVKALPAVKIDAKSLCFGETWLYDGKVAAPTATIYEWTNVATSYSQTFTATATAPATVLNSGIVKLKVTDVNGCSSTDTAMVKWNTKIGVVLNYTSASHPISSDASTVIATCAETPVTLTATSTTSTGVKSYKWSNDASNTTNTIVVAVAAGTSKVVRLDMTDNKGCTTFDEVTITAYAAPVIGVAKSTICLDESFAIKVIAPTVIATYNWYNSLGVQVHTGTSFLPTAPSTYTLIGLTPAPAGCISNTITLTVNPLPIVTISIDGNTLTANSNSLNYKWFNTNNLSTPINGETGSSFTASVNGSYLVEVTDINGCSASSDAVFVVATGLNGSSAKENQLNVYPNPSNGAFTIESFKAGNFTIVNAMGQTVASFKLSEASNYRANIEGLSDGIYFITNENSGGTVHQKVVVKK